MRRWYRDILLVRRVWLRATVRLKRCSRYGEVLSKRIGLSS
jgi:hypothetical protein